MVLVLSLVRKKHHESTLKTSVSFSDQGEYIRFTNQTGAPGEPGADGPTGPTGPIGMLNYVFVFYIVYNDILIYCS